MLKNSLRNSELKNKYIKKLIAYMSRLSRFLFNLCCCDLLLMLFCILANLNLDLNIETMIRIELSSIRKNGITAELKPSANDKIC